MTQILSLALPKKGKIFVKENEQVSRGSVLAEGKEEGERETVSIAQVFKIPPDQIFKVLTQKLGDKVKKGEILAQKEGIFAKIVLKSPIDGRLVEVSQTLGEATLEGKGRNVVVKSPVSGKIKEIKEKEIKIEFEGEVFKGIRGGGEESFGIIENLPPGAGVLDLSSKIRKKILVSLHFSQAVVAKAWALGAAGVVGAGFSSKDPPFPFLILEKKDIGSLRGYQGKEAILEPVNKQLIIIY